MWLYFAQKEKGIKKTMYLKKAKCLLLERARIYKSGRSWVGVPIEIDYEELKADCELDNLRINRIWEAISFAAVHLIQKQKNKVTDCENITVKEM